jgi:hypothetical protein
MIEENDYFIIKPYKNRQKMELYIHNNDLKSKLSQAPIHIIREDLTELTTFDKKCLFRSKKYGEIIKLCLDLYVEAKISTELTLKLKEFFDQKLNSIPPHINLEKNEVKEGYYTHILKDLKALGR